MILDFFPTGKGGEARVTENGEKSSKLLKKETGREAFLVQSLMKTYVSSQHFLSKRMKGKKMKMSNKKNVSITMERFFSAGPKMKQYWRGRAMIVTC